MSAGNGQYDQHIARSLTIARGLVAAGVPLFVAPADPTAATGYRLPNGWNTSTPNVDVIERWRPGWALCAVMGHTVDLLDLDPRSGDPLGALIEAGQWPREYASAWTPSGGRHAFIASLGMGSRDALLPGLDIKGGRPDGSGRGFAFIAPTVRVSKLDGTPRTYAWAADPDWEGLDGLASRRWPDESGRGLAELIGRARPGAATAWARVPTGEIEVVRAPARSFTPREAWEFVRPWLDRLSAAPDGSRNATLNDAAKVFSHFGEEFWPYEHAVGWLLQALPPKDFGHRDWDPVRTIESAFSKRDQDWRAEFRPEGAGFPGSSPVDGPTFGSTELAVVRSRTVDLGPFLDGTYQAPVPDRGIVRDGDGCNLLYSGRWHTVIGSAGAGKTWLALAHAAEEMRAGRTVAYAHFEEVLPIETVSRLLGMGLDREVLRERFAWLDCSVPWADGEMAAALASIHPYPSLVVLDGINAACALHNLDPAQVQAVGWYRQAFVTPAAMNGAAVLSLGHPPKARDRQDERHGFGSTAWLDLVDGVGYRLRAGANQIRRGASGTAQLYSVKDRGGGVEMHGVGDQREGWVYLGSLVVDNATDPEGGVRVRLSMPAGENARQVVDELDVIGTGVIELLRGKLGGQYESEQTLNDELRARGIKATRPTLAAALVRLEENGYLARDEGGHGLRKGGQLLLGD